MMTLIVMKADQGEIMRARFLIWIGLFTLILTGCRAQETRLVPAEELYRPPTQVPTEIPLPAAFPDSGLESGAEDRKPTPTPVCTNSLLFLEDLTIPDGTVVEQGERLDKRWRVQNNGSCNWNQHYGVKLIAGPGMGMPVQQALFPARSGTDVTIRMVFLAPSEPGNYRSAWQAYDPHGLPFGDPFFIDIVVQDSD